MADDSFRSYRSRDALARDDGIPPALDGAGDPLAELARLIGQSDPYADRQHDTYGPEQSVDDSVGAGVDWAADDGYATHTDRADDRYAPPPPPPPLAPSYPSYEPQARGYEDEPSADGRYFSEPPAKFDGFRDNARLRDHDDQNRFGADARQHDSGETYAPDDYYDDPPNPRPQTGTVVVMAVLGLAVVGIAGAFAYRTMFGGYGLTFPPILQAMLGGYSLPHLPPSIKATNGPNKITPNYGESQANSATPSGAGPSTEKVVSREEQPMTIEPPKVNSRVASAIPVASSQNAPTAGANAPLPAGPATMAAPAGSTAAPAPMPGPPSAPSSAAAPQQPAPMNAATPPAAATSAPTSTEPKKVHTVTIRADQAGGADAVPMPPTPPPVPAPAPAVRNVPRPAPSAARPSVAPSPAPSGASAPLSIVPGAEGNAIAPAPVPARTRLAAAPVAVASTAPVARASAVPSPGGRYTVQVSSQRSEAEAQAAFQTLRSKFPTQLGSREPIIRRADLGAKGIYYRALVGPFASMEKAAGMCSNLKAAGGNCLVQRN
jgi:SPOR domain